MTRLDSVGGNIPRERTTGRRGTRKGRNKYKERERERERVTKVGRPEEIGRRPNLRQRRAKRLLKKEDEANGLRERHR